MCVNILWLLMKIECKIYFRFIYRLGEKASEFFIELIQHAKMGEVEFYLVAHPKHAMQCPHGIKKLFLGASKQIAQRCWLSSSLTGFPPSSYPGREEYEETRPIVLSSFCESKGFLSDPMSPH